MGLKPSGITDNRNGPDVRLRCLVKIELVLKRIDGLKTGVTASKTALGECEITNARSQFLG